MKKLLVLLLSLTVNVLAQVSAGIPVGGTPPPAGVNAQSGAGYNVVVADQGKLITLSNAAAQTVSLPAPAPQAGWYVFLQNTGAGAWTVNRGTANIDGAATNLTLNTGQGVQINSDGSNYFTQRGIGGAGGGSGTVNSGTAAQLAYYATTGNGVSGNSGTSLTAGGKLTTAGGATGLATVTFSATPTYDASVTNGFKLTLTGNVTSSTLSNAVAGQVVTFVFCQDATGGRTNVWPTNVKGGGIITPTANICSMQSFEYDGTNAYATGGMTDTGTNGGLQATEGTGADLVPAAGTDTMWPDSTAHRWKMNNNNTGATNVPGVTTAAVAGNCTKFAANGIDLVDAGAVCGGGGGATTLTIANAGTTGTTLNTLTKLTGAPSTAVITATTDTAGAVGITTAGAGTTGSATITYAGSASCVFDGATTAGDYVQISATTAGDCHDVGATYPTSNQVIGRVLSTNAAGGTFTLDLFPSEVKAGAGASGYTTVQSPPGTNLTGRTTLAVRDGLSASDDAGNTRTNLDLDIDASIVFVDDDFCGGAPTPTLGQTMWVAGGGGSIINGPGNFGTTFPNLCALRLTSGAVASTYETMGKYNASFAALGSNNNWNSKFTFKLEQTTNTRAAVGFFIANGNTQTLAATDWFGLRYDTNAGSADTAFKFVACKASACTVHATNLGVVNTNFHTLRLYSTTAGEIHAVLDAGTDLCFNSGGTGGCTASANVSTSELTPNFVCGNDTTAAASNCQADAFKFKARGLAR